MARGVKRLYGADTDVLERLAFDYWRATSETRDAGMRRIILDRIRDKVQANITGIPWDARLERLLIDTVLNYSTSRQISFLTYFCRRMTDVLYLTEAQEQRLSAVAREANISGVASSDYTEENTDLTDWFRQMWLQPAQKHQEGL